MPGFSHSVNRNFSSEPGTSQEKFGQTTSQRKGPDTDRNLLPLFKKKKSSVATAAALHTTRLRKEREPGDR